MISPFSHYLARGKARKKTPDPEESRALLSKACQRLIFRESPTINTRDAPFSLENSCEAMREAAQALMSYKWYKPYSHEATISFLKDQHNDCFPEEDIQIFDFYRQLRNNSVYRAIVILPKDASACTQFAERIAKKIQKIMMRKDLSHTQCSVPPHNISTKHNQSK